MTTWIHKVADRIAGLFLPEHQAGACVPENGQLDWSLGCGSCGCTTDFRWRRMDCRCRYNCWGTCINTGETRCVRTQLIC